MMRNTIARLRISSVTDFSVQMPNNIKQNLASNWWFTRNVSLVPQSLVLKYPSVLASGNMYVCNPVSVSKYFKS